MIINFKSVYSNYDPKVTTTTVDLDVKVHSDDEEFTNLRLVKRFKGNIKEIQLYEDKKILKDYGISTEQTHEYRELLYYTGMTNTETLSIGDSTKKIDKTIYIKDKLDNENATKETFLSFIQSGEKLIPNEKYIVDKEKGMLIKNSATNSYNMTLHKNIGDEYFLKYFTSQPSPIYAKLDMNRKVPMVTSITSNMEYINSNCDIASLYELDIDEGEEVKYSVQIARNVIIRMGVEEYNTIIKRLKSDSKEYIGIVETIKPHIEAFNSNFEQELNCHAISVSDSCVYEITNYSFPNNAINTYYVVIIGGSYFVIKHHDNAYDIYKAKLFKQVSGIVEAEYIREFGSSPNLHPYMYKYVYRVPRTLSVSFSSETMEYECEYDYENGDIKGHFVEPDMYTFFNQNVVSGIDNIVKFSNDEVNTMDFIDNLNRILEMTVYRHNVRLDFSNNPASIYDAVLFLDNIIIGEFRPSQFFDSYNGYYKHKNEVEYNSFMRPANVMNHYVVEPNVASMLTPEVLSKLDKEYFKE